MKSIEEMLSQYTISSRLCRKLEDGRMLCLACGHRCRIREGRQGVCKVRFHRNGELKVPFGYVAGLQCDPIEKKPFFHVRPGAAALSFGMLGCNYHCEFCQNWISSQVLRDPESVPYLSRINERELVQSARKEGAEIVVSTYNEPLITCEWAVSIFREAKRAGMMTAFVSNGNATSEVLQFVHPWLDLFKVDLKCFNDRKYRKLGGRLQPVLDTIRELYSMGIWIEIVTLLIPGFNDSMDEIHALTGFIKDVSPEIPWHVTAYRKSYKMTGPDYTTPGSLLQAVEIGKMQGLRYIYAGNLTGNAGDMENTRCPECGELLVERIGYRILHCGLGPEGKCPHCNTIIPGRWAQAG